MCFSATASFVAGTALSGIGVATVRNSCDRSELPLALIPLLFGVQQLIEGVVWLTFQHDAPTLKQISTYSYLVFSHVLWPMYIPFAMRSLEFVPWRKHTLLIFQTIGIIVGMYLLFFIVTRPVVAEIDGMHIVRHLVYDSPHFYVIPVMVLYVAATCVSCFFSSHPFVRLFGVLAFLSFVGTYLFYVRALVSVWCFFAAVLSLTIYLHLHYRKLGGFPAHDGAHGIRSRST